jgi:hypothetical protein
MDGKTQLRQKDWQSAESSYENCLQLQKQALGTRDPRLFQTLARLVFCCLQLHEPVKLKNNLIWAMAIFTAHGKEVITDVNQRENAVSVWRPLARASREVATQSNDPIYFKWTAIFYDLTIKAWKGPTDSDTYRGLVKDYQMALAVSGDLNGGKAQGPKPKTQASTSKGKPAAKHPSNFEHHGRMVIWHR